MSTDITITIIARRLSPIPRPTLSFELDLWVFVKSASVESSIANPVLSFTLLLAVVNRNG